MYINVCVCACTEIMKIKEIALVINHQVNRSSNKDKRNSSSNNKNKKNSKIKI